MRSNLGPLSDPWAREVEQRLQALEAPQPDTAKASPRPRSAVFLRLLTATLDYDRPDRTGRTVTLPVAAPPWATRVAPVRFQPSNGRFDPDTELPMFDSYRLMSKTPSEPEWRVLTGMFENVNVHVLDGSGLIELQFWDTRPNTDVDQTTMQVLVVLAWLT